MRFLRGSALLLLPIGLVVYPLLGLGAGLVFILLSRPVRGWSWWIFTVGVLGAALAAALVSNWRLAALLDVLLGALVIGLIILVYMRVAREQLHWFGLGLAAAGGVMGVMALQQTWVLGFGQALGFSFHPNVAAALALVVAFGGVGVLGGVQGWGWRLVVLLGVGLAVLALLLSGSRASYLGFAAGSSALVLLALLRGGPVAARLALLAAVGVGATLLWFGWQSEDWGVLEVVRPRIESLGNLEGTTGGRVFMTLLGLEMIAIRPFLGFGFGAWQRLVPVVEPAFNVDVLPHSHNLYIELLLDGGSLFLVAVLLFFAALAWVLLRYSWQGSWLAAASLAALVGVAVMNSFDVVAYQPNVMALFLLVFFQGLLASGKGVVNLKA